LGEEADKTKTERNERKKKLTVGVEKKRGGRKLDKPSNSTTRTPPAKKGEGSGILELINWGISEKKKNRTGEGKTA